MTRYLSYSLLGLIACVLFVAGQVPAATAVDKIALLLPGFSAEQVEGSAFSGKAQGRPAP